MATLVIVARKADAWSQDLLDSLQSADPQSQFVFVPVADFISRDVSENGAGGESAFLYLPAYADRECMAPDLCEAREVFQQLARIRPRKLVLISSALIYGTGTSRQVMVSEDYSTPNQAHDAIAGRWRSLEALAQECLDGDGDGVTPVTVLRPTTVMPSPALLSRRIAKRVSLTLAGHNPTVQLLGMDDMAQAVLCAARSGKAGAFNVTPDGLAPLRAVIRLAGGNRLPLPRTWQRLVHRSSALEYLRYPWTVSNEKIKTCLGFAPAETTAEVALSCRRTRSAEVPAGGFDEFGMDRRYIESRSRGIFKFLCDRYWRIEREGLENVPREGRAILVGTHRGFMPMDAVMALHLVLQATGRIPRYLIHPGLLKFPFIADFITRLGGAIACRESADRILERGELLGVFPEGVQGAFTPYRQAYQVRSFKRDDFVKIALRHRAPIIPYVTVGSAEIFPIFKQIKWRRWMRYSDWPCLPISTFPFFPFPLPTKWHIQFLPPIHPDQQWSLDAAGNEDATIVKQISTEVRSQMQAAVDKIIARRRSWFRGSVFEREKSPSKARGPYPREMLK